NYPYYYVLPELVLVSSSVEYDKVGIFFARTIRTIGFNNRLNIVIQISALLVAYGLLGTLHAILTHEFLHYLELLRGIITINIIKIPFESILSLEVDDDVKEKITAYEMASRATMSF